MTLYPMRSSVIALENAPECLHASFSPAGICSGTVASAPCLAARPPDRFARTSIMRAKHSRDCAFSALCRAYCTVPRMDGEFAHCALSRTRGTMEASVRKCAMLCSMCATTHAHNACAFAAVHEMRVESAVVPVRHANLLPCSEGIGLGGAQARGAVQHRERAELLGRRRSDFTLPPPPHSAALANVSIYSNSAGASPAMR